MPLYQMMLDIAQQKAQIQGAEMLNALRATEISQTIKQNKIEDETRQRLQTLELLRLAREEKMDPNKGPMDDMPAALHEPVLGMKRAEGDYNHFTGAAQQARLAGNLKEADAFDKLAKDARTNMAAYEGRVLAWTKENEKEKGAAAGAYEESPNFAIERMKELDPKWDRKPGLEVDRDAMGGVKPGPLTAKTMKALQLQAMTANEQLQRKETQARIDENKLRDEENKRAHKKAEEDRATAETRHREETDSKNKERDARTKQIEKRTEQIERTKKEAKDPNSKTVMLLAAKLQKDLTISGTDAPMMARDVLLEAARLREEDPELGPTEAQTEAIDKLKSLIKREPAKKGAWYNPLASDEEGALRYRPLSVEGVTAKPEESSRATGGKIKGTDAPQPIVDAMVKYNPALTKAGVGVRWNNGKLIIDGIDAKGNNRELAQEAQRALDAGKDPEAVLKRLKELVR